MSTRAFLDGLHAHGRDHDASLDDRLLRLRNMTPDAAALIAQIIRAAGSADVLEIGSSNGYSSIWFAEAVSTHGGRLSTVEIDPARAAAARDNLARAGVTATVLDGDGGEVLAGLPNTSVDLVVLDAERGEYPAYWPDLVRVLRPRGVIAVDNALSHAAEVDPFTRMVAAHPAFSVALHPVGDGVFTAVRSATA